MVVHEGLVGSGSPHTAVSKLEQFHSSHLTLSLSEETMQPFYLVAITHRKIEK